MSVFQETRFTGKKKKKRRIKEKLVMSSSEGVRVDKILPSYNSRELIHVDRNIRESRVLMPKTFCTPGKQANFSLFFRKVFGNLFCGKSYFVYSLNPFFWNLLSGTKVLQLHSLFVNFPLSSHAYVVKHRLSQIFVGSNFFPCLSLTHFRCISRS